MISEEKSRFLREAEAAYTERRPIEGCAVKKLSRTHVHVAYKLAHWPVPNPSHEQLSRAAACSVRTVRNALAALRALGLLTWVHRVVSIQGWRAQVANAYRMASGTAEKIKSVVMEIRPANFAASGVFEACRAIVGRYGRPGAAPPPPALVVQKGKGRPDLLAARVAAWNAGQVARIAGRPGLA